MQVTEKLNLQEFQNLSDGQQTLLRQSTDQQIHSKADPFFTFSTPSTFSEETTPSIRKFPAHKQPQNHFQSNSFKQNTRRQSVKVPYRLLLKLCPERRNFKTYAQLFF